MIKKTNNWRGYKIYEKELIWYYSDNNQPVAECPQRVCGHCKIKNRFDSCDSCIGRIPFIMNACCGHGIRKNQYLQINNGKVLSPFLSNIIIFLIIKLKLRTIFDFFSN